MIRCFTYLALLFLCLKHFCVMHAQEATPSEAIADAYVLTMDHMQNYLKMAVLTGDISTDATASEINDLGSELVQLFQTDPSNTIELLEAFAADLTALDGAAAAAVPSAQSKLLPPPATTPASTLPHGHQYIRDLLGQDIGEMNFHSAEASELRQYLYHSLLYSSSSAYDRSVTGSHDSAAETKIMFCPDGSFVQVNAGHLSVGVDGLDLSTSGGDDVMRGYWDVSTLPSGLHFILFYSTDPSMLEDSPNGFLPFPIATYTTDAVLMPGGDGYSRTIDTEACR